EATLDLRTQRPVAVAAVRRVLEERTLAREAVELVAIEEVVVAAVDLALARRAGRRRNRHLESRDVVEQPRDQRSLAAPARARDDEDPSDGEARRARRAGAPRGRRSSCSARSGTG